MGYISVVRHPKPGADRAANPRLKAPGYFCTNRCWACGDVAKVRARGADSLIKADPWANLG